MREDIKKERPQSALVHFTSQTTQRNKLQLVSAKLAASCELCPCPLSDASIVTRQAESETAPLRLASYPPSSPHHTQCTHITQDIHSHYRHPSKAFVMLPWAVLSPGLCHLACSVRSSFLPGRHVHFIQVFF